MKKNETHYEIVVVGGGMVGATLALALAQAGFQILVIDVMSPTPSVNDSYPDLRVSAISCTSVKLLRHVGAWQRLDSQFYVPYRRLETWEWPSSVVSFDASCLNLKELGFIVENRRLRQALWEGFIDCNTLTLRCPALLTSITRNKDHWRLIFSDKSSVTSQLIVGADGMNSWVRQHVGIAVKGWQYRQFCLLLSIKMNSEQQQDITWQEFHPSGPRAFLPLYGRWALLVWYDSAARIRQLERLSLLDLSREIQEAFPKRLSAFTLHRIESLPLTSLHAQHYILPGLALIGDAAHTINPLAGQGVNLGFRDANTLTETLITARNHGERWETWIVLCRYQRRRRYDNLLMQAVVDAFYVMFSNNLPPLVLARNFGLMLVQHAGRFKRKVLRYALGI